MSDCKIYLISPPEISDLAAFSGALDEVLASVEVACFQLRLKDKDGLAPSDEKVLIAAQTLIPLCRARGVAVLINDRPDLAKQSGADGVHIGQSDTAYETARAMLGEEASIGVTCHNSRHLALEAGESGADYVAFGAFYPTNTKAAPTRAEPDLLSWWQEMTTVPCVAIGGINAENCAPLVKAGADFLAVCGAIWSHHPGPKAGGIALYEAINRAHHA